MRERTPVSTAPPSPPVLEPTDLVSLSFQEHEFESRRQSRQYEECTCSGCEPSGCTSCAECHTLFSSSTAHRQPIVPATHHEKVGLVKQTSTSYTIANQVSDISGSSRRSLQMITGYIYGWILSVTHNTVELLMKRIFSPFSTTTCSRLVYPRLHIYFTHVSNCAFPVHSKSTQTQSGR